MNTQSNDVVKTADLNSNEQQKVVKPIIVSRRRLLRAGAAGIPIMLTMAGVAPAIEGVTQSSAASGMNYDGMGTVARISKSGVMENDNMIWSNDGGFVYKKSTGELFTKGIPTSAATYSSDSSDTETLTFKTTSDAVNAGYASEISVSVSSSLTLVSSDYVIKSYLHKNGSFYVPTTTGATTVPSGYFEKKNNPEITVKDSASTYTISFTTDGGPNYDAPKIELEYGDGNGLWAVPSNGHEYYGLDWYRAENNSSDKIKMTFTVKGLKFTVEDSTKDPTTATYTWTADTDGKTFTFSGILVTTPTRYEN